MRGYLRKCYLDIWRAPVRGRSQKQWVDYVREVPQLAGLSLTWWKKSQDRANWRVAIQDVLQRI